MRTKRIRWLIASIAVAMAAAFTTAAVAQADPAHHDKTDAAHQTAVYYQTQYSGDTYVSPLPLADNGATDVIVGAVHLNAKDSANIVTLNDNPPGDSRYDQMWADLDAVKAKGVKVTAMVGGAAKGSFQRLDTDFDTYYPVLRDLVSKYKLDGVDLDVEEDMSLAGIEKVIDALRTDFGDGFIVTLAPVATDLSGGGGLSGFNYDDLYRDRGDKISWFNTQFYCGWGSLDSTSDFDAIAGHNVVPASKVVAGTLTNPDNCGSGYVDIDTLKSTIGSLKQKYPDFGGIAGWEYFNSLPGGTDSPWQWSKEVSGALA
ncbi:MAG TPA: glycosyl hydrolase family 18 protein [Stackebrandtia sp.]|jgi:chitinase|uniref:glycosyl hydrolase family 18 protein n=1 Tax=Stackebrandtia sp. TaxID=2023065 RepID=UPI002D65B27C|nr:glycosyl hydrolase family 18 protein [Stackebrandtia sp.]HZE40791.1 glycosyl hydrolase family 18 protein [Stackebrandtia sp.]